MIKTDLKITTNHMLALAAAGMVGYGMYRAKNAIANNINKVNPVSNENIVYKGVESTVGEQRFAGAADKVFASIDLINPFNESDRYALEVWGFGGSE